MDCADSPIAPNTFIHSLAVALALVKLVIRFRVELDRALELDPVSLHLLVKKLCLLRTIHASLFLFNPCNCNKCTI